MKFKQENAAPGPLTELTKTETNCVAGGVSTDNNGANGGGVGYGGGHGNGKGLGAYNSNENARFHIDLP